MPPNKEVKINKHKAISAQLDLSLFLIETAPWMTFVVYSHQRYLGLPRHM